jgi:phosphatidylglycerophosphatase A
MKNKWIHYIATGFGSGLAPKAPGTCGSAAALLFLPLLSPLSSFWYLLFLLITFATGIYLCGQASDYLQKHDAGEIVWDEFVGIWLTFYLVPLSPLNCLLGFLFFRLFDILKPFPISYIDKNVKGGLGIMLDDILAGICALICMHIYLRFV